MTPQMTLGQLSPPVVPFSTTSLSFPFHSPAPAHPSTKAVFHTIFLFCILYSSVFLKWLASRILVTCATIYGNKATILISQLILGYLIFNISHTQSKDWKITFFRTFNMSICISEHMCKSLYTYVMFSECRSCTLRSRLVSVHFCYSGEIEHVPSHSSWATLICAIA